MNIVAEGENAIDVLKRIFQMNHQNMDSIPRLNLIVVGNSFENLKKISCNLDLNEVSPETAASFICKSVGYEYEIREPYFIVSLNENSKAETLKVFFLGNVEKLFSSKIIAAQPEKTISEELQLKFNSISKGFTKDVQIAYSNKENTILVKGSREQVNAIGSMIELARIGVVFSDDR